jgi:phosphogluconate 2-dehydrogenase
MTRGSSNQRWRVLISDPEYAGVVGQVAAQFPDVELVCPDDATTLADLSAQPFDGLISDQARVDDQLIERIDGMRVVLKMGRKYDNIDAAAVRARNLVFASSPRKGPNCVAELAMTFILALSKDMLISHRAVAEGAYRLRGLRPERSEQWKMAFHWMRHERLHEVRGKTLGIIGMGEIGCELARRASVMGMRNLYYKRTPLPEELERRFEAEYRDLSDLLRESDYVCIVVPHTSETERMIGAEQFELMKPDAYFVNCCRGGVVDEDALIEALSTRRIAGAGLDVFTFEPLPADSPLCRMDNVIMTPHVGGGTGTNRGLELTEALEEMSRILSGERPRVDLD